MREGFKVFHDRHTYSAPMMVRVNDDIDDEAIDGAVSYKAAHTDDLALIDGADRSKTAEQRPLALLARRGGPADSAEQPDVLRYRRKTLDKIHARGRLSRLA